MKKEETSGLKNALKAYDNKKFLHSRDGRLLRIMSEYLYPEQRFKTLGIERTIIFFGSARIFPENIIEGQINEIKKLLIDTTSKRRINKLNSQIDGLERRKQLSKYYEDARILSRMLCDWIQTLPDNKKLHICTGGGPGIMEAANRGAHEAGMNTIGLNISLPFEQFPNKYIHPDLNFEFHYFFMRKFWLVYPSEILIVFPGGFGTLDEMMEVLTLRQTGKMKHPRMILIYGESWWKNCINFDNMAKYGVIDDIDLKLYDSAETPTEAFKIIKNKLMKNIK